MIAIDTNILVYAFDIAYPEKRAVCQKIISDIFEGKMQGVVTNQILAEFAAATMRKIEKPLSSSEVQAVIGTIITSANWKVFNYTGKTVMNALFSKQPFWDALIAETLHENQVSSLITENTKDFATHKVKTENPFAHRRTQ